MISRRLKMKHVLTYLKDYKKESVLAPLFKMLEASFELFVPLVVAAVIDNGIPNDDKPYIGKMFLLMVLLAIVGLASAITAQYYAAKAAVGVSKSMRNGLFRHIQSLSFSEIDEVGTSTLITRMTNDINQVQSGVNLFLRLFLRSPFIVFGAMIMAFTVDVKGALVFVVTIPLLSVVVFGIMLWTMPLFKKVQQRVDKLLGITKGNLEGVRVIRAFRKEQDEINDFNEENELLRDIQLKAGKISALMNPITYIIINGAIIFLMYVGAIRVDGGALKQGQVLALVNYMSQILVELVKLANLIITVTKAIACANRIEGVFAMEPSIVKGVGSAEFVKGAPVVEFKDVSFMYKDGAEDAIEHISFSVNEGETVGIIGGTGSGKSTIVNLIPRFYDVTGGEVRIDGVNVKDIDASKIRDRIGVVMQNNLLFKGTIEENLRFSNPNATNEQIEKALEISCSKEFVDNKKDRLQYMILQGGKNLSGGQKQRLTIARALVREPRILILDDSSSALDYATDAKLRTGIKQMRKDGAVFIVSQRTSSIQHADKIIVMDDGRVIGMGTHSELLENCELYQEIHKTQTK